MEETGKALPVVSIPVRFGSHPGDRGLTPGRRAIERIKRKATGMASAAAVEPLASDDWPCPGEDTAKDPVGPALARVCRCADADVNAYREGADWICHTCGHKLSERASGLLAGMAAPRDRSPGARAATQMQLPVS